MSNLRRLAARVRAQTGRNPPTAGAVPIDAPLTPEQWESMLALEARLLVERANGRVLDLKAEQFLTFMPHIRAARARLAGAGEPFEVAFGVDLKRELAAEDEEQG